MLETRPKPGAKIRVSGGGRCNLLPSVVEPTDFHTTGSANTLRNILLSWPLAEVRSFFEQDLAIPLKVEPTGKVFPESERPIEVVQALLEECHRVGGEIRTRSRVNSLERTPDGFALGLGSEERIFARRVLLATGGLSLPKTGSDGGGLGLARALGHDLAPTHPVLVPLTSPDPAWRALSGLSVDATVRVRIDDRVIDERTGSMLFTHRGFSGPLILDASRALASRAVGQAHVGVHWGGTSVDWKARLLSPGRTSAGGLVRDMLPRRLADRLLDLAGVAPEKRVAELARSERISLESTLCDCVLPVDGNEGYRTAEATGGGIRLGDIRPKTLESRIVPGLHFAGEMLDVDGRIGGYNFLWAFVSGRRAGAGAARRLQATDADR